MMTERDWSWNAGSMSVTVLNRYPYNNGHLLIAPKQHVARLDRARRGGAVGDVADDQPHGCTLDKVLQPHGYNVGLNLGQAAGAGVPGHLHWHIVPRWSGDTNFMSSVAGVRTIPQSLEALWDLLAGGKWMQMAEGKHENTDS